MKKFWIFCALVFAGFTGNGQTLAAGDLAIIGYKINPGSTVEGFLTVIARTSISSGQTIGFTHKFYYSGAFGNLTKKGGSGYQDLTSDKGYITITFNEAVSAGEVFTLSWTSSGVASSKGVASLSGSFDFGNTDQRIIWLYTGTLASPTVINALMYSPSSGSNLWSVHNDTPTGISFANLSGFSAPYNALNLNVSGSSDKCGTWYSATALPGLSGDLGQSFYHITSGTPTYWKFGTSNGSVNACDLSDVTTKVVDYLESNVQMNALILSFGKKRAGSSSLTKLGYWYKNGVEQSSGYNPWVSESAYNLKSSTVYIYGELTLGSFSSSSSSNSLETFFVGDLRIIDSAGCPGKVIVSPGDILDIQYQVSMSDKETQSPNVLPKISLSSNIDASSNQHYAQIAPTGAQLTGNYEYKLYIGSPGWHRIYSPIRTTWSNVTPSLSSFVFTYGSTGSTRNIYYYDPSGPLNSSGVSQFWQYVSSSDSASDRPVNVYFAPGGSETPCVLTFNGTLKYPNLDAGTTLSSSTSSNTLNTSSPGYGAPWYGTNYNGWNLYGNHGLSFIDVSSLKTNYYDLSQIPNVSMSVYVWDPYDKTSSIGSSTLNNYYIHNGQTGDSKALYISPFTAFFVNTTNPGAAAYPIGRKAMSASSHTGISNKTAESIGLVTVGPAGLEYTVYASPIPESLSSKNSLNYNAVSSGLGEGILYVHEDSNFYRIRQVDEPVLYRELPLAFTSGLQNEIYTIKNHGDFPTNLNSYLVDSKEQKVIDLAKTEYSFKSDTATNLNRFKWILSKTSIGVEEVFNVNNLECFIDQNGALRISNCLESSSIEVIDAFGNSIVVIQKESHMNEATIDGAKYWPKGLYVVKTSNGLWQKIVVL